MSTAFDVTRQQALLESRVALALEHAQKLGASACEVGASASHGLEVAVRLGEVDTMELASDQSIAVTVYNGTSQGSASTSDVGEAALRETVEKACAIARYTAADEYAGLAEQELLATQFPDLDLYHPWAISPDEAIEVALRCEGAGRSVAGITNSGGATFSNGQAVTLYANSHGFMGSNRGTQCGYSCMLIGGEGESMQRDAEFSSARAHQDLASPEWVGQQAADKVLARLMPRQAVTGNFPVVFAPRLAAGLIGNLMQGISGGALYRESSFLCDSLDSALMPDWFSLAEHPYALRGARSANFDGDGVATRNNTFIEAGKVASYLLSTYSARRLGMATTGNAGGARNLRMEAPLTPYSELLGQVSRGVIVTELMGQGVNMVTGDYSRGAAGFWVENGVIQYPIEGFTIAGNLRQMFANLQAVGDDVDTRGNIHTGSWLIDGMMVAG